MANRERGEVSITVDGPPQKTYTLRLGMNDMAELEDTVSKAMGRDVTYQEIASKAARGSIRYVRWVYWAALQHYHSEEISTVDQVGDLVDQIGKEHLQQAMQQAMEPDARDVKEVVPAGEAGEANPPTAQAGGTGDASNSSPYVPV